MENKKIIESRIIKNYQVLSDTGWVDIIAVHKTIPYKIWEIETESGQKLKSADNHILFVPSDDTFQQNDEIREIYVKDLKIGQSILIDEGGKIDFDKVVNIIQYDETEHMYDLELAKTSNHRYYTNNILSHNTSLARVLAVGRDYIYINASEERGIDTVRETITDFCSTVSMLGNNVQKLIILDEIDGAADLFFKALRATTEKFPDVRFIATCNYVNKVPVTMFSRLLLVEFDPKNKEEEEELHNLYIDRVKLLSTKKYLDITWEDNELIREFVAKNYPDFRKIVNKLQDFKISEVTHIKRDDLKQLNYSYNTLFSAILANKANPRENYILIMGEYANKTEEVFEAIGKEFIPWLEENHPNKYTSAYAAIVIATAELQAKRRLVIDPIITLLALIYTIQKELK